MLSNTFSNFSKFYKPLLAFFSSKHSKKSDHKTHKTSCKTDLQAKIIRNVQASNRVRQSCWYTG